MTSRRLAPASTSDHAVSGARWPFALSTRALLLLGGGLVFVVPAMIDRRALLLMAAWDLLLLALACIDGSRLPKPGQLRATRSWSAPLALGSASQVTVLLENGGRTPIAARVADYVAPALRADLPAFELRAEPGGTAAGSYGVRPRERGDHENGPVALTWWSGWRLAERWATVPLGQPVRVYPDLAEGRSEALYLIRSRQVALEKRRARHAGSGREFESLRDYRQGDERRDIYWRASARRGKLVTKVYQPERSQPVWILVDAGRLLRARTADRTMLDVSVTAAVTLAQVALASGDKVGLLAYGRRVQTRLAPARGAGHLRTLIEALAMVRSDAVDADHASAVATLLTSQKRRALIVWLTEIAETAGVPDVIEQALTMTSRHLVLFGVMRQRPMQALAAASPASVNEMYRVAAAQEALERRDALLLSLRQRSALVLEVSPAELSAGIVDRYLEARDRGLL